MATKQYSYHNYPNLREVRILDQNISEHVSNIENISSSLDYPNINEYEVSQCTITVKDPNNQFNPEVSSNFFTMHGTGSTPPITNIGYRAPVEIRAGFLVGTDQRTQIIFSGQILNISRDARTRICTITCTDRTQKIRTEPITDFGLEKRMVVNPTSAGLHGNYAFYDALTPPSTESISGTSGSTTLVRQRALKTEGFLDEKNFIETDDGIQTEGGPLATDPLLNMKAPYRNIRIRDAVTRLLAKYGINNPTIELPLVSQGSSFFSNLGRADYETAFSDLMATNPGIWQWGGIVTDLLADESNNRIYALISQTGSSLPSTGNPDPKIIRWDLASDTKTVVRELNASSNAEEAWRMAANSGFTTFYVLGTRPVYINATTTSRAGWAFGSYDSAEATTTDNSKILIQRIGNAQSSPTLSTFIDHNVSSDLWPQLGIHYRLDADRTRQERYNTLPDSRRSLIVDSSGTLYYPYANATDFGVAKSSSSNSATSVLSTKVDEDGFNASGFSWDLSADKVYLGYYYKTDSGTGFKIIRGDA